MCKFVFFVFCLLQGSWCLSGVNLRVPTAIRAGDSLQLSCEYSLEKETLYSVKFYKADDEFYRYVPKESPPTRVFPQPGIKVDISRSNSSTVTLSDVQRDMTGFYKCEVSADAPLFHTDIKSALVIVTEDPISLPVITAEKYKYSLGEKIRANCTSQGGYPAANLTWFLNGQQARSNSQTRIFPTHAHNSAGSEISRLQIEVDATPSIFPEGKLKLGCLASQFSTYKRISELDLQEDTPQLAPVMGPTAPHSHDVAFARRQSISIYPVVGAVLAVASFR